MKLYKKKKTRKTETTRENTENWKEEKTTSNFPKCEDANDPKWLREDFSNQKTT